MAVRRLIHLDYRRYFSNLVPAFVAAVAMTLVVLGLKQIGSGYHTNAQLMLLALFLGGVATYLLAMRIAAPGTLTSMRRAVLDMVR